MDLACCSWRLVACAGRAKAGREWLQGEEALNLGCLSQWPVPALGPRCDCQTMAITAVHWGLVNASKPQHIQDTAEGSREPARGPCPRRAGGAASTEHSLCAHLCFCIMHLGGRPLPTSQLGRMRSGEKLNFVLPVSCSLKPVSFLHISEHPESL